MTKSSVCLFITWAAQMFPKNSMSLAALIFVLCIFAGRAAAFQLLSLQDFSLQPTEYITKFRIATWGVRVRGVCAMPFGWSISFHSSATEDGLVTGQASHGVTWLDAGNVDQLQDMLLIEDVDERLDKPRIFKNGYEPQTFDGRILVGIREGDSPERWRRMKPQNFVLKPAAGCPQVKSFYQSPK